MAIHSVQKIFQTLNEISNMKDNSTYLWRHHLRVTTITGQMANAMNLSPELCEIIHRASFCHDIGKVGIENNILFKPGQLSANEWKKMKTHPVLGAELISNSIDYLQLEGFEDIVAAVLHHHERWDGKGYPTGLKGKEIPLAARIIAVADAYEAMTSDRPYRKGLNKEDALKEIVRCVCTQFDPEIVSYLISIEYLLR